MMRPRKHRIPPDEKTSVLAVMATLGLIILFLSQSHARATSEAAAKDLHTVCATLNQIAPEARNEKHIVAACAHPDWFAGYDGEKTPARPNDDL